MGRRTEWEAEERPIEEILVSILSGAGQDGIRFADIAREAVQKGISRATVARYLPKLVERDIVKREERGYKRVYYRLTRESLSKMHVQRALFSVLSMYIFNDLYEAVTAGGLDSRKFTDLFVRKVGTLAMYTFLKAFSVAEEEPKEAGRWIEEAFGTLTQKDGWRQCLSRQIFGGPVDLKKPIMLKLPISPQITVDERAIYVEPPAAISPGLSEEVLKRLPSIPEDRLNSLKASLRELSPKEVDILNQVLSEIEVAAKIVGGE